MTIVDQRNIIINWSIIIYELERRKGCKFEGGGSSNVVGIICPPLIFIGVNGPPNFGGTHVSLSVILTIVV